jgi:hypothetical protein
MRKLLTNEKRILNSLIELTRGLVPFVSSRSVSEDFKDTGRGVSRKRCKSVRKLNRKKSTFIAVAQNTGNGRKNPSRTNEVSKSRIGFVVARRYVQDHLMVSAELDEYLGTIICVLTIRCPLNWSMLDLLFDVGVARNEIGAGGSAVTDCSQMIRKSAGLLLPDYVDRVTLLCRKR